MTRLRVLLVAVLLVSTAVASPASAQPAGIAFTGTMWVDCFGCGPSGAGMDLTLAGTHAGAAQASFTMNEPGGSSCIVAGTASGELTGAIAFSFNWTRNGPYAIFTTYGDTVGIGVLTIVPNDVLGFQCGRPLVAQVSGVLPGL